MELKPENWFYCGGCETPAYKFDCCGNTSCNGGGCPECMTLFDEAWRQVDIGEAPKREELRSFSETFEAAK